MTCIPRFLFALIAFCQAIGLAQAASPGSLEDGMYAEIATSHGLLIAKLHYDEVPMTVANFVGLAEGRLGPRRGTPYFHGLVFHRVVPGFVIQGGDPLGTGEGGPGYQFPDEFVPGLRHDRAGVLSMANSGPDTNGSQFFITLNEVNRLNYLHSVFGRVVSGNELLTRIQKGDTMKIRILRVGRRARDFAADAQSFMALKDRAGVFQGAAESGPEAFFDDPDKLLPSEPPRAKAFNVKLANVKRSTGIEIKARIHASAPVEFQGSREAAARDLDQRARSLHLGERAALAVYFADRDQWFLWLGTECRASLAVAASKSTGEEERILADAVNVAAQSTRHAKASLGPGASLPEAQRIKLGVDALLDCLIFSLESGSSPTRASGSRP